MMNKIIYGILSSFLFLLSGCSDDTTVLIPTVSLTVSPGEVILSPGEEHTLSAVFSPVGTTDDKIVWSSSDESVATVDTNGVVQAVAYGKVAITASTARVSGICHVEVSPNVYVAGRIGAYPALWRNGRLLWQAERVGLVGSGSMHVANGVSYVAADAYDATLGESKACLYVNGAYRPLADIPGTTSSEAMGVTVSGDDVYVAGYCHYDSGAPVNSQAVLWKNNKYELLAPNGYANDIAMNDKGDVYLTGYYFTGTGSILVPVWKNGKEIFTCECDGTNAFGFAVYVCGDDVYTGGNITDADGIQWAVVWKNGKICQRLHQGDRPFVSDLYVTPDGIVYAVGSKIVYPDPNNPFLSREQPLLWIDGSEQPVGFNDRNNNISSIVLFENRIYTAGTYGLFDGLNQGFYMTDERRIDFDCGEWTTSAGNLVYVTE